MGEASTSDFFVFQILGPPSLGTDSGESVASLGPGKSLGMLAYLAVRGQARRDELIELLWGAMPNDKARNAFRQSLHRLRTSLGETVLPQDREKVALGPSGRLRIDRSEFLAAVDAGRWSDAVQLYRGDFLDGFELDEAGFDQWADAERVRLRAKFQTALTAAAKQAQQSGDFAAAIPLARRLCDTAPFDEEAALLEATLLVSAGRPAEALASANTFASRLRDELGLPTPASLQSLIARLERGTAGSSPATRSNVSASNSPPLIPFVGRESELSRLLASVAELRNERGATLLISGDAGSGKTRLLDEFTERARALGGVRWLRGRERAATASVPYAGVADALRSLVRAPGVGGASRHLLAEASRLLPELRDSFDLPATSAIEDEAGRIRFFEGIAAAIEAAAYEQPLCIVVDDVQHASTASMDLLAYLSGRLHTSPVLLVIAMRDDHAARPIADRLRALLRADHSPTMDLELGPLSATDARSLARIALQGDASDANVERVVQHALGKPFALVELSRRLRAGASVSDDIVAMRDVLWARLQTASPSQRRVFFAASLLDRSASARLLANASHLPEPATREAVEWLVREGLLRDTGNGFVVAHDSASTFVVESSGIAGRALLAGWAADALAAERDCTDAELATLYAMAGQTSRAFTHARAAALAAIAVGATPEVTRLVGIALTFAPDDAARAELESMLGVVAGNTRRLRSGSATAAPTEDDDVQDVEVEVAPAEAPATPHATPRVRPRTTKGQWYMSVALSVIVVLLGILVRRQTVVSSSMNRSRPDSLLLIERDAAGRSQFYVAPITRQGEALPALELATGIALGPSWLDSIAAPWSDPLVSPDRNRVALARATPHGKDIYVVSADRRDTIAVVGGAGDNAALDWSPDSRVLLVARARPLADGSYHADLVAYLAHRAAEPRVIDTASERSVTEAKWSPAGSSIAWVSRSAATRQQDVFVSRADGRNIRVVAESPADERSIAWSPDGSLLTFTSTRSGAPRLFTFDVDADKLWPTSDRDGEDRARYSPDGRLIAFESTRDGDAAVYVRPPLGGTPRRVSPKGAQYSIASWNNWHGRYVDRLRIVGASSLTVGDTVRLSVLGIEPNGTAVPGVAVEWSVSGASVTEVGSPASAPSVDKTLIAASEGAAVVVAAIPGWRVDTLNFTVGTTRELRLEDSFQSALDTRRWIALGEPSPTVGTQQGISMLLPSGDFEWESGVLSRDLFELRPGLSLHARLFAPFGGRATPGTLSLSLVPGIVGQTLDQRAPRFAPTVGATWDGRSGGFAFTVGRESNVDALVAQQPAVSHTLDIRVQSDSGVVFLIDGAERWRSSLRFVGDTRSARFQLWIASRAMGTSVGVADLSLRQAAR